MKRRRRHIVMADPIYDLLTKMAEARTRRLGGAIRRGGNGIASQSGVIEELIRQQAAREGFDVPRLPLPTSADDDSPSPPPS